MEQEWEILQTLPNHNSQQPPSMVIAEAGWHNLLLALLLKKIESPFKRTLEEKGCSVSAGKLYNNNWCLLL